MLPRQAVRKKGHFHPAAAEEISVFISTQIQPMEFWKQCHADSRCAGRDSFLGPAGLIDAVAWPYASRHHATDLPLPDLAEKGW